MTDYLKRIFGIPYTCFRMALCHKCGVPNKDRNHYNFNSPRSWLTNFYSTPLLPNSVGKRNNRKELVESNLRSPWNDFTRGTQRSVVKNKGQMVEEWMWQWHSTGITDKEYHWTWKIRCRVTAKRENCQRLNIFNFFSRSFKKIRNLDICRGDDGN